jgi:tryptophan synthase alpha chain
VALEASAIDPVFLIAPTTTAERIAKIGTVASGFVYYVSLKGVTGAANLDVDSVREKVELIRQHIDLPIGVGFGISDADTASRVSACSDAVVVGSAIVKRMAAHNEHTPDQAELIIEDVSALLASMRKAMDANTTEEITRTA